MADIYLTVKKDREGYARCYREIVDHKPTVEACLLLGDAYMHIHEPEKAVIAYQNALQIKGNISLCQVKIGQALTAMHEYERAVKFYQSAASNFSLDDLPMIYDYCVLLEQLQRYDEVEGILSRVLGDLTGNLY